MYILVYFWEKKNKLQKKKQVVWKNASVFSFVVTFFLPQHGTNCRTVLLLVGSRYSIFLCFLGVLFFFLPVWVLSLQPKWPWLFWQERRGQKKTNKKKQTQPKPSPTMYIYCLCISKITHSVQTKLLGARARLQECVPDFVFSSKLLLLFSLSYSAVW